MIKKTLFVSPHDDRVARTGCSAASPSARLICFGEVEIAVRLRGVEPFAGAGDKIACPPER